MSDVTDLIERLRGYRALSIAEHPPVCDEAADALERLTRPADAVEAEREAVERGWLVLERMSLLAGDANMNDPLRKWFNIADFHDADAAIRGAK